MKPLRQDPDRELSTGIGVAGRTQPMKALVMDDKVSGNSDDSGETQAPWMRRSDTDPVPPDQSKNNGRLSPVSEDGWDAAIGEDAEDAIILSPDPDYDFDELLKSFLGDDARASVVVEQSEGDGRFVASLVGEVIAVEEESYFVRELIDEARKVLSEYGGRGVIDIGNGCMLVLSSSGLGVWKNYQLLHPVDNSLERTEILNAINLGVIRPEKIVSGLTPLQEKLSGLFRLNDGFSRNNLDTFNRIMIKFKTLEEGYKFILIDKAGHPLNSKVEYIVFEPNNGKYEKLVIGSLQYLEAIRVAESVLGNSVVEIVQDDQAPFLRYEIEDSVRLTNNLISLRSRDEQSISNLLNPALLHTLSLSPADMARVGMAVDEVIRSESGVTQTIEGAVEPGTTQAIEGVVEPGTTQTIEGVVEPGTTQIAVGVVNPGMTQESSLVYGSNRPAGDFAVTEMIGGSVPRNVSEEPTGRRRQRTKTLLKGELPAIGSDDPRDTMEDLGAETSASGESELSRDEIGRKSTGLERVLSKLIGIFTRK